MTKNIIKPVLKISALTTLFFLLISFGNQALSWWIFSDSTSNTNTENFVSSDSTELNEIGVALSINIGTKFYEETDTSDSLYNEVLSIPTIESNSKRAKDIILTKNLEAIRDYSNLMKVNIKGYLESGDNREESYNSLLNQLKIRYKNGYVNAKNLTIQRDNLVSNLKSINTAIENTKQSIGANMKAYNALELGANVDQYLELKARYNVIRTYAVFCNKFLTYYKSLNAYNINVINVLRLNKTAIITNTYVVIPNGGSDLLKELNLIYDEGDIGTDNSGVDMNIDTSGGLSNSSTNSGNSIFGSAVIKTSEIKNNDSSIIPQTGKIDFGVNRLGNNE